MSGKTDASLLTQALRLLAMREHSRVELRRKLGGRGDGTDDLESLLDGLEQKGLLSDARFAESYVRSKAGRLGSARLRRELGERGVSSDIVTVVLDEALPDDELTRARVVWQKKFGDPPQDRNDWARQARFLQTRGFTVEVIRKLLKEPFDESA